MVKVWVKRHKRKYTFTRARKSALKKVQRKNHTHKRHVKRHTKRRRASGYRSVF